MDPESDLLKIVDGEEGAAENYQLFYRLDKRCRDLEKENVSLKQQLLKDREAFEREKEQLLLKQSELYGISAKFDVFKAQIKDLLGVQSDNADILIKALSRREASDRDSASNKALSTKNQRIETLEAELRELKSLYQKTESDNASKSSQIADLTKKVGKQFKRIETLRSLLSSHLELTGAATVEASLDAIRALKRKVKKYRSIIKEQVMTELKRARSGSEGSELKDIIAQQGQIIEMVVKSMHDLAANIPRTSANERATETLERTRLDLNRRIEKLSTSMQVHASETSSGQEEAEQLSVCDDTGMATASVVSDSDASSYEEMKECVWLNKTRELLALERQLADTQKRVTAMNLDKRNNAQIHATRHPIVYSGNVQATYL